MLWVLWYRYHQSCVQISNKVFTDDKIREKSVKFLDDGIVCDILFVGYKDYVQTEGEVVISVM